MNAADARITLARYGPLAACAAVLVWHSLQYRFVTDDAFISFVYSRNLAEHGELVFNQGMDPVEGYTNFLWTILLGLLMVVGLLPEITSLVLGTGFAIGTLVVVHRTSAHIWRGRSAWDLVAPTLLALSAGFACWRVRRAYAPAQATHVRAGTRTVPSGRAKAAAASSTAARTSATTPGGADAIAAARRPDSADTDSHQSSAEA